MRQCFCRIEMAWAKGIPGGRGGSLGQHRHHRHDNVTSTYRGRIPIARFLAISQAPLPDPALASSGGASRRSKPGFRVPLRADPCVRQVPSKPPEADLCAHFDSVRHKAHKGSIRGKVSASVSAVNAPNNQATHRKIDAKTKNTRRKTFIFSPDTMIYLSRRQERRFLVAVSRQANSCVWAIARGKSAKANSACEGKIHVFDDQLNDPFRPQSRSTESEK